MTLLETTYRQLQSAGLVQCAEAFSRDYLGRNSNWYAYNKHRGRDFSTSAAIECLRNLRSATQSEGYSKSQQQALLTAEHLVSMHLRKQHTIAKVSFCPSQN